MLRNTIQIYAKRAIGLVATVLTAGTITAYAGIGTVPVLPFQDVPTAAVQNPGLTGAGTEQLPQSPAQDPSLAGGQGTVGQNAGVQGTVVQNTGVQDPSLAAGQGTAGQNAGVQDPSLAAGQGTAGQNAGVQNPSGQLTGPSMDFNYLGGAELTLLASATGGQNLSCVIQSKSGSVIVVDGGLREDTDHLVETIQAKGGRVAAWLITHPHSDHIGALTEILNRDPIPIQIDGIYYSFLERDTYERGENMGRMSDYDNLMAAFTRVPAEKLHTPLNKGQTIQVDEITINVMNLPFRTLSNTFNNSSVAYRLDVNGRRILFLGDMGWDAGQNLLDKNKSEDLKADVVQMAHHGQDGVEEGIYRVIRPEICLWPTPEWLWDNNRYGVKGDGPWKTLAVRAWMEALGVQRHLVAKDGDQILR